MMSMYFCNISTYEPFWQDASVKSLIIRWQLRPVGLLSFIPYLSYKLKLALLMICHESVCPSVHLSLNISHFHSLGQFQPNLTQSIIRSFKFVRRKVHTSFQREIIAKLQKYIHIIENSFPRTICMLWWIDQCNSFQSFNQTQVSQWFFNNI